MTGTRTGAQSVERAIAVLRAIEAGEDAGLGISQVAELTDLTVSTAHRLTRALCAAGLVLQDPATERYQLGPALVVLGQRAERVLGYDRLRPVLADLVAETRESANLGILVGGEVLVVVGVPSPQPLRYELQAGTRVPAHTSAMGKALLSHQPSPVAAIGELAALHRHTERTITEPDALLAQLDEVRRRGWALNDGERDTGVRAVGAPVLDTHGHAVAAIAVQGPAARLTSGALPTLAEQVRATAARVATLLP